MLLGNMISLAGCVLMVAIGLLKKKEQILGAQCVQFALMGAGNLALGAVAGVVSNAVSIVRNLVFARTENTTWLKLGFIAVQAALTYAFGGGVLIEWLPVITVVVYTWFLDLKNPVTFKLMIIGCQGMWVVYDWYYRNYVAFSFDLLTIVSTIMGIAMLKKEKTD